MQVLPRLFALVVAGAVGCTTALDPDDLRVPPAEVRLARPAAVRVEAAGVPNPGMTITDGTSSYTIDRNAYSARLAEELRRALRAAGAAPPESTARPWCSSPPSAPRALARAASAWTTPRDAPA